MDKPISLTVKIHTEKTDPDFIRKMFRHTESEEKLNEQTRLIIAKRALERAEKEREEKLYQKKLTSVRSVIENDPAAPENINSEEMSQWIMNAAQETGVDPAVIANIARRESHFEQKVPASLGTGIMQLTTISIEDMYQRPELYGGEIKKILAKYKNPKGLMAAIKKDPALNIKIGAYNYKAKLKLAKGDEFKALAFYNGSPGQIPYAKAVSSWIAQTRENMSFEVEA